MREDAQVWLQKETLSAHCNHHVAEGLQQISVLSPANKWAEAAVSFTCSEQIKMEIYNGWTVWRERVQPVWVDTQLVS